MSRRPRAEMQFGSDSFLDVTCNIVGILIILLVLVGIRAARAPVVVPAAILEEPAAAPVLPEATPAPLPEYAEAAPAPLPEPVPEPELEPVVVPPQVLAAAESLEAEAQQLAAQRQFTEQRATAANERQSQLADRLAMLQTLTQKKSAEASARDRDVAASKLALTTLKQTVAQLEQQRQEAEVKLLEREASSLIEHRITPVGRLVNGEERHYRLQGNRVSVVPLQLLIDRLKEQVERRKDWLAKARQHHGQVGPIDGYLLNYVVQREALSVVDELRNGQGVYRISVAQWQLDPQRDLPTESVEQAIARGGRFSTSLLDAPPDATVTFWVYPDSYDAYSRLKTYCHDHDFYVAGRPLPDGVPIAGSPNGSRSAGQ